MATYTPVPLPSHLPSALTISLWDFSWYVRSGAGEPFEDLETVVAQAVERGYNTIRICAAPFLLFAPELSPSSLTVEPLGGAYAQRVRWYDVAASATFDPRARLVELFEACKRHDVFIILSSWEYQQSASFSSTPEWWDALDAVDAAARLVRLAECFAAMIDFLAERGLDDRIAFTELHNEVIDGHLADGIEVDSRVEVYRAMTSRLSAGLARFHELQPTRPVTVNYARVPVEAMNSIPEDVDVLVFHPYVYGVLDEVVEALDLRGGLDTFDQARAVATGILRADAPDARTWVLPDALAWKMRATIVGKPEIFLHDWVETGAFDRFLYERYESHRAEMNRTLREWLDCAADAGWARGVPVVFGEGWIGYTPLDSEFEGGPVGADFCRRAVAESRRIGAYGTLVCSNAAPHHSMWWDVKLQQECNAAFRG
jgi:hypothetical protein